MGVSLKQVGTILNMTRKEVMDLVAAGRLKVEQKNNRQTVDEADLAILLSDFKPDSEGATPGRPRQLSLPEMLAGPLTERIGGIEKVLSERLDLLAENKRLDQDLTRARADLAAREAELQKLKVEKAVLEKEAMERQRSLDERREFMEKEFSDRSSREREEFEGRLQTEKKAWAERFAEERRKYASELQHLKSNQGFWNKLVKMLTWS